MNKKVRLHECSTCDLSWVSTVRLSKATPNLSGEPAEWCPYCGARASASSVQYRLYEHFDNDVAEYDRKVDTDPRWGEPDLNALLDEIAQDEHDDKTIIRTLRHIGARLTRIEERLGL